MDFDEQASNEQTGVVSNIISFGTVVRVLVKLDPGQGRALRIVHWDHRAFAAAWEGGLRKGSRVTILDEEGQTLLRLEDE